MPIMSPRMPGGPGLLQGALGNIPPVRPQIVASRGSVPSSQWGNGASGRHDTLLECRRKLFIGPSDVSMLQVANCGYYLKNDSTGEHTLGSDFTWTAALELGDASASFKLYSGQSPNINIPDGSPGVFTDPLAVDIAAGAAIFVRHREAVASSANDLFPTTANATASESGYVAPSGTTAIYSTGAITTVSGGAAFAGTLPLMVVGRPKIGHPSVIIDGDSISVGTGDTIDAATGAIGFIARGLNNVNGFTIPYQWNGVGGDKLSLNLLTNEWRKRFSWQYATHIVFQQSTNDINAGASLAQLKSYVDANLIAAKRIIGPYDKPLKTAWSLCMPRTTSTDAWATAVNQTPVAGFESGGIRDQFNAYLIARVGDGYLDAVIDPTPAVEDPSNHGKWIASQTTDGIHPISAAHIAAAAYVNNWALGITQ